MDGESESGVEGIVRVFGTTAAPGLVAVFVFDAGELLAFKRIKIRIGATE